jgi:hypothetical protein
VHVGMTHVAGQLQPASYYCPLQLAVGGKVDVQQQVLCTRKQHVGDASILVHYFCVEWEAVCVLLRNGCSAHIAARSGQTCTGAEIHKPWMHNARVTSAVLQLQLTSSEAPEAGSALFTVSATSVVVAVFGLALPLTITTRRTCMQQHVKL